MCNDVIEFEIGLRVKKPGNKLKRRKRGKKIFDDSAEMSWEHKIKRERREMRGIRKGRKGREGNEEQNSVLIWGDEIGSE